MKRDDTAFFRAIRPLIGGADKKLTTDQVAGVNALLSAFDRYGDGDLRKLANILGQVQRETGGLMTPVREGFKDSDADARAYVKRQGYKYAKPGRNRGQWAYGRGPIQLTHDDNYERADRELSLGGRLIANYDLALDPKIGAQIAVRGMMEGWFTGKKLADYFNSKVTNWQQARRIVNAMDHADEVATNSKRFHAALLASVEPDANSDVAALVPPPEPAPAGPAKQPVNWAGAGAAVGGTIVAAQAGVQAVNSTVTTVRDTATQAVETVTTIRETSQGLAAWMPSPSIMVAVGIVIVAIGIATIYLRHKLAKEQGV